MMKVHLLFSYLYKQKAYIHCENKLIVVLTNHLSSVCFYMA